MLVVSDVRFVHVPPHVCMEDAVSYLCCTGTLEILTNGFVRSHVWNVIACLQHRSMNFETQISMVDPGRPIFRREPVQIQLVSVCPPSLPLRGRRFLPSGGPSLPVQVNLNLAKSRESLVRWWGQAARNGEQVEAGVAMGDRPKVLRAARFQERVHPSHRRHRCLPTSPHAQT